MNAKRILELARLDQIEKARASPHLRFTLDEANNAADQWGFNCGPAAICAVLGLKPCAVRPHMQDFERKGYTNPTLMFGVLNSLGVLFSKLRAPREEWEGFRETGRGEPPPPPWPKFGLARVQWGGRWTEAGVPMAARYRHTHWVGSHKEGDEHRVFDVNATAFGGWLPFAEWSEQLVPWLLKECEPKADGRWWLTHALEIGR